ncbi:hypothetical protein EI94DRAFT_1718708 [Lactarius quietus]|nr:hypothetical protein EI94DRAFT_1718708 [Lactarius quietus]
MDDRLNLKQLKIQAAARRLSENQLENARICQFEVPGGGECRDADCGDMHLSQLEVEPNGAPRPLILCFSHDGHHLIGWMRLVSVSVYLFADDETAQYLCGDQNVAQMIQALQAARARRPEATFIERVKEAWESLRVQASLDSKT